jgi:hypothetical protein
MPQCKGKTTKGTRCLRSSKKGSEYCAQHCGSPKKGSYKKSKSASSSRKGKGHRAPSAYNKFVKANLHKMAGTPTEKMRAVAKAWRKLH